MSKGFVMIRALLIIVAVHKLQRGVYGLKFFWNHRDQVFGKSTYLNVEGHIVA